MCFVTQLKGNKPPTAWQSPGHSLMRPVCVQDGGIGAAGKARINTESRYLSTAISCSVKPCLQPETAWLKHPEPLLCNKASAGLVTQVICLRLSTFVVHGGHRLFPSANQRKAHSLP